jgi:hypothetical protein
VRSDAVNYENRSDKKIRRYSISYIRFRESVVRLYRQFEVVWLYVAWLPCRAEGVGGKIV